VKATGARRVRSSQLLRAVVTIAMSLETACHIKKTTLLPVFDENTLKIILIKMMMHNCKFFSVQYDRDVCTDV